MSSKITGSNLQLTMHKHNYYVSKALIGMLLLLSKKKDECFFLLKEQ